MILLLICIAGVTMLLISLASLLAGVAFVRKLYLPISGQTGNVCLILPLAGACPALPGLISRLNAQSLQARQLLIAVESTQDPAYRWALQQAVHATFPVKVIVAGLATECAQKCWNQIAAIQQLEGCDDVVVLLDGDIEPPVWWLSLLVTPVLEGRADVVTGYRWHRATHLQLGQQLIAAIDRGIALLPSFRSARLTWGGSIALSASARAALNLPLLLSRVLSDDCAIGASAHSLGLRVLTRRLLRVPTPPHNSLSSAWRFGRRQYQIIRIYRPALWALAFGTLTARLLGWLILFVNLGQSPVAAILLLLIGMALFMVVLSQQVAARLGMRDLPMGYFGQILCALLKPLVDLFHWTLVAAAWNVNTLRWGHVRYQIVSAQCIHVAERTPWA